MKKIFIIAALAFGALAGCTKDNSSVEISGDSVVKFTSATIATRTVDDSWESGDLIGISTSGMLTDYQNMQYIATTTEISTTTAFESVDVDNTIFYPNSQSSNITFNAYYPFSDTYDTDNDYITIDISDQKDDMGAIDFMTAESTWRLSDGSEKEIAFDFEHKLSKVIFDLTILDEAGIDDSSEIEDNSYEATIYNVVKSKAYNTKTGAEYDDGVADELTSFDLTTAPNGESPLNRTVTAILHPSNVDATVELLLNGKKFTFSLSETLLSGKSYRYYVTVGRNEVKVGVCTINGWDSETTSSDISAYLNDGDGTIYNCTNNAILYDGISQSGNIAYEDSGIVINSVD